VRLAFKLFDSEGVALVNLLRDGSGALDEMRERARDLGIVLDEHLVRDAERARTELDTLAQVISANLTRAALEAAPVIADLSSWLADVAGKAGIAWERLFDAPEEKSLRTLRYELDLASSSIEKLEGRIDDIEHANMLVFDLDPGEGVAGQRARMCRKRASLPRSRRRCSGKRTSRHRRWHASSAASPPSTPRATTAANVGVLLGCGLCNMPFHALMLFQVIEHAFGDQLIPSGIGVPAIRLHIHHPEGFDRSVDTLSRG
jgi:hypothetical protein